MITSEEVAKLAGVSRATVSRILNGSSRISAKTQKRVHAAMLQLGYEPNIVAQNLVRRRSSTIALGLFPNDAHSLTSHFEMPQYYFYIDVLRCVEEAGVSAGYDLLLPARPIGNSSTNYINSLKTRRVAGTIMLALGPADPRIQALISSDIPTVFIDDMAQGSHVTYIKSDNTAGVRQAVEYLIQLGHQRIATIHGLTIHLTGLERLMGYQQGLANAALIPDPGLIRQSGWNTDDAFAATKALLAERRDFTAIVAGSDLMAVGVLRALRESGIDVPAQMSVIGFDDVNLCTFVTPTLTTIRQDRQAIGRQAVKLLIEMIDGQTDISPVIIPTSLVVRGSTGAPPVAKGQK